MSAHEIRMTLEQWLSENQVLDEDNMLYLCPDWRPRTTDDRPCTEFIQYGRASCTTNIDATEIDDIDWTETDEIYCRRHGDHVETPSHEWAEWLDEVVDRFETIIAPGQVAAFERAAPVTLRDVW